MRIDTGPTREEKAFLKSQWHPFFPWWPRKVGSNDSRTFEWIERRYHGEFRGSDRAWQYRLPHPKKHDQSLYEWMDDEFSRNDDRPVDPNSMIRGEPFISIHTAKGIVIKAMQLYGRKR